MEVKCPRFAELLRYKRVLKKDVFRQQQLVQIAVNDAVNWVRKAIAKDETEVWIPMDKYHHDVDSRILAKEVLAEHGFKFIAPNKKDNSQFEYWRVDLSEPQPQASHAEE